MSEKKYWKGMEQREGTPAYQEKAANEFEATPLPFEDITDSLLGATTPRRDFLKYLGFSTGAAMLAASCEMPVRHVIPYAIKPEDIVPGIANYYASTFIDGGDYCPIVIKTRDGRPIKLEGNALSSITEGGTSARVQAAVLSLYDNTRLRQPHSGGQPVDLMSTVDKPIMAGLNSGKKNYLLTNTIMSPTIMAAIDQFVAHYPNTQHVTYDALSCSAMLLANEASYGKRSLPTYHFDRAATIVSLDADFLGTWISPTEYAKQYSKNRRVSAANPKMSRHYHVEGHHTITGAAADMRAVCKPSEVGAIALALYNAVAGGGAPQLSTPRLNELVTNAAKDLKAGNGLVVSGSNDVNVQTVVNAINNAIGANGSTINWGTSSNYRKGIDADMVALANDVKAGNVGALLVFGCNPVYEYMDGKEFGEQMAKIPVTVSFADRIDETAEKCKYVVPDHHFLESWGDAEPRTGYYSLMQPGIAPLFKTRAFADSLLLWAGSSTNYGDMWTTWWKEKLGGQENFDKALQDGVVEPGSRMAMMADESATETFVQDGMTIAVTRDAPMSTLSGATYNGNTATASSAINAGKTTGMEVVIYEKVSIGRGGVWSNNPWLQEMPDPITKATWDNYACISPAYAKKLDGGNGIDLEVTSINEVITAKRQLNIKVNGKTLTLPAVVVPGMHNDVIAIAVGYGRSPKVGKAAAGTDKDGNVYGGKNVYPFLNWNNTTFIKYSTGATVEKSADPAYDVAITQTHNSYEGRAIIREYTLEHFQKEPMHLLEERKEEIGHYAHLPWLSADGKHAEHEGGGEHGGAEHGGEHDDFEKGFRENGTMYPSYDDNADHGGLHWGMSIDLTTCIGCGACTIACQAENNISVVGKSKVLKSQEMHWLTIDRYFAGNPDNSDSIQTVFQPMMCQHCDNAPCENVCPVSATNHSSEGLNQMAYNRCIGTKYCANNCPYKVRHFNWMDWNGADCFDDNLYEDGRRDIMNEDLTRMVLNPDVTVRSRGVMEKCSFCVQRLQEAKLESKKLGEPLKDGVARTACQQSCPTNAILFGNVNDSNSAISHLRKHEQKERTYYVLEEIHTLPNVNYLSKVRNTDAIIGGTEKDEMMNEHI